MYSQLLTIQEVFMHFAVTDNAIQRPVTYVHCSYFTANKNIPQRVT